MVRCEGSEPRTTHLKMSAVAPSFLILSASPQGEGSGAVLLILSS